MGSLEYAIPSVGGFCVGTSYVVDHQRLSGLGYCFSASLPPMLAAAAISALESMEQQTDMFFELNNVCRNLHQALSSMHHLKLGGHKDAPVKHLRLAKSTGCHKHDGQLLRQIANEVITDRFIKFGVKPSTQRQLLLSFSVNEKRPSSYCSFLSRSVGAFPSPTKFTSCSKQTSQRSRPGTSHQDP